jgi:8-oxo-dGTP pyrophosphatase MutT (NUDIX family)
MQKKLPFKREFSSGCVVYKKIKIKNKKLEILFLIGKHSGYHKWVLPKGMIELGEKDWQTALRETEEEMGVKAKLVSDKPIHKEEYFFVADIKKCKNQNAKIKMTIQNAKFEESTRRIDKYQEQGGSKVKVFKTVTFYLAEYLSGDPKDHGWEMSEAGWYDYKTALSKMAFEEEKEAVKKAIRLIINKKE